MRKSRFTEEQIVHALRQAETGTPAVEVCRKLGVTEQTFYRWKRKFAGLGIAELRRLRQVEEENRRLKQLVADLTLDKHMLQEVIRKNSEAGPETGVGEVSASRLWSERAACLPGHPGASIDATLSQSTIRPKCASPALAGLGRSSRALWLPAAACPLAARRMEDQPQAGLSAVS